MRRGTVVCTAWRTAALFIALCASVYPLLWMVSAGLRSEGALLRAPFGLPWPPSVENLRVVFRNAAFGRAYLNSLLVTCVGVAATLAVGAPAAFAFARLRFRARGALFLVFLAGLVIPVHVTLVPLNRLLGPGALGLKGTVWALVGPYAGFALPLTILILRNAFRQLPREVFDAAESDGCGPWGAFLYVALPMVRPALATVTVFNFLTLWNEFAFALTLVTHKRHYTLPLAVWEFTGEYGMHITTTCAALAVAILPALLVYILAQRHVLRGLTAGAVKG